MKGINSHTYTQLHTSTRDRTHTREYDSAKVVHSMFTVRLAFCCFPRSKLRPFPSHQQIRAEINTSLFISWCGGDIFKKVVSSAVCLYLNSNSPGALHGQEFISTDIFGLNTHVCNKHEYNRKLNFERYFKGNLL